MADNILNKKYKEKYGLQWCESCDIATISLLEEDCHGSSCNGGGCDNCLKDFIEFNKLKIGINDYLTDKEYRIYEKVRRLKDLILESLELGDKEIDWKKMIVDGRLSNWDIDIFKKEIDFPARK